MSAENCACGRKLHYSDPGIFAQVLDMIALAENEYVDVVDIAGGEVYVVQRHYIALHGLKTWELPDLARKGIVQRKEADGGS